MVSYQEIARGMETVLRQSDPNVVTSLNGVVQQLEAKLRLDLFPQGLFVGSEQNLSEFEKVTCSRSITTKSSKALAYRLAFLSIHYDIGSKECLLILAISRMQQFSPDIGIYGSSSLLVKASSYNSQDWLLRLNYRDIKHMGKTSGT